MRFLPAVLASLLLVAGCSSDDEPSAQPSSTPSSSPSQKDIEPTGCDLDAAVTGAEKARLSASGDFNPSQDASQPSLYIFEQGDVRLTVLASDGDFPTAVTYQGKSGRFTSQDSEEIDVDPDGSGGSLNVVLAGDGAEVAVTGEIVCGSDREGKSGKKSGSKRG